MGFAQVLRGRWWVAGAPTFVALYVSSRSPIPAMVPADRPMRDPALLSAAREYAREQGTEPIPVRVEEVSSYTDSPNAFAAGMDSSRKVFIWDTLLDGRFADDEVRMVLAHEIAHHSREHIWKGVGWYAIFAVPGTFLIALATRRRGSLREAQAVPVALFAFVALSMAAQPLFNVLGRRMESEADWVALETTEDPDGARHLFVHFTDVRARRPVTARVGIRALRHASDDAGQDPNGRGLAGAVGEPFPSLTPTHPGKFRVAALSPGLRADLVTIRPPGLPCHVR